MRIAADTDSDRTYLMLHSGALEDGTLVSVSGSLLHSEHGIRTASTREAAARNSAVLLDGTRVCGAQNAVGIVAGGDDAGRVLTLVPLYGDTTCKCVLLVQPVDCVRVLRAASVCATVRTVLHRVRAGVYTHAIGASGCAVSVVRNQLAQARLRDALREGGAHDVHFSRLLDDVLCEYAGTPPQDDIPAEEKAACLLNACHVLGTGTQLAMQRAIRAVIQRASTAAAAQKTAVALLCIVLTHVCAAHG